MLQRTFLVLTTILTIALVSSGCATKKYVRAEVDDSATRTSDSVNKKIGDLEGQIEANQTQLADHDQKISTASKTAQEALERAKAAGKLAEGKFLYEVVLSNDKIRFEFEKATLSDEAKAALDEFAAPLRSSNESVFLEIQGHTDSSGSEDFNLILGERRAEAVRRYLNQALDLPLHRMSVISYGESEPIADNSTREGRAENRRVVIVVLQ